MHSQYPSIEGENHVTSVDALDAFFVCNHCLSDSVELQFSHFTNLFDYLVFGVRSIVKFDSKWCDTLQNMAKSLDDLVDFLLDEIALDSGRGKSNISCKWDVVKAPIFPPQVWWSSRWTTPSTPWAFTTGPSAKLVVNSHCSLLTYLPPLSKKLLSSNTLNHQARRSKILSATQETSMRNRTIVLLLCLHRLPSTLPPLTSIRTSLARSGNG